MFNNTLNKFCLDANEITRKKGFWDSMDNACLQLDGEALQDTKDAFIVQKIALVGTEISEAIEAIRKQSYGLEQKDTFEDEIADTFIRLADLCGELGIDIEKQIKWKLEHNKSREYKHGKSF